MRRRWLALAVILTAPSGCDNVKWGGVEVHLEPAPSMVPDSAAAAAEEGASRPTAAELVTGPVLLAGTRAGSSATLAVVGIVQGDALAVLPPAERAPGLRDALGTSLAPGADLVLFSEGVRVGRLTVTTTGLDETICAARPTVTGVVELIPAAAGVQRLIALLDTEASRRPHGDFEVLEHDYALRLMTINLASDALGPLGAPSPPDLVSARADIHAFRLPEEPGPSVAATFLHQDRLAVSAPLGDAAYALFVMGTSVAGAEPSSYLWYRRAADDGKGAPRYFGHLDWNGDGRSEILLEILGADRRSFAGLAKRGTSWVRTFEDPCEPTT